MLGTAAMCIELMKDMVCIVLASVCGARKGSLGQRHGDLTQLRRVLLGRLVPVNPASQTRAPTLPEARHRIRPFRSMTKMYAETLVM